MRDHQKLVEEFRRAMFTDHDPAALGRLYTEDAVLKDAALSEPIRGREAIVAYHASFLRAFPDLSGEALNVFGSGDWFAAEFRVRGTHTGPLELGPDTTIPPTGRSVEVAVCWIGRLSPDGLCREDHSYYDTAPFTSLVGAAAA